MYLVDQLTVLWHKSRALFMYLVDQLTVLWQVKSSVHVFSGSTDSSLA